ncbi:MAG: hypothetical protein NTV57_09840 [Cyanobacteria bacterium]|nr:hypothetical protein [Cyanobacteriota bacterium]
MLWLQRWNFIERARQERVLWDAFEQGDDLEALIETCRLEAETGDGDARFRLEIWQTTLVRIRRIEALMKDKQAPRG